MCPSRPGKTTVFGPVEISAETGRDTGQDASAGTIQAFRRGFEKKKFQAKRLVCA
tara:strand:+ start:467 stop:631 length:165 start_codon:yes stop_codon:yes gene_type:complete